MKNKLKMSFLHFKNILNLFFGEFMNTLFEKALGIINPWKVTSIDFDKNKKLDIYIDFTRGATFPDDSDDNPVWDK